MTTAAPADKTAKKQPKRSVRLTDREEKRDWRPKFLRYERNVKKSEVADAVRSLGIMLATSRGETVPLATLAEQYKGTTVGNAFGRIYQSVQSGQKSMAEAFVDENKVFPKIVADLLFVGSRSGTASINLQKAADIIDEGQDLTQKIKSAVIQPAILLGVIILFLYAVILFILPVFAGMFKSFGKPLPPLSQGIIIGGNVFAYAGGAITILVIGWVIYYKNWGKHIKVLRIGVARFTLKLPVLGKVLLAQRLTQVFSILSGLLSVGMSEREALETAAQASGNAAMRDHIEMHMEEMDRGNVDFADIADGFLIPLTAGYMLRNGFDSGAEVKALDGLATVYKRDANKRAENLTQALEPLANGAVGAIFAIVLIATYLPVYDLFLGLTKVT